MNKNCWESSPRIEHSEKFKNLNSEAISNNNTIRVSLNKNGLVWHEKDSDAPHLIRYKEIINVRKSKINGGLCINYLQQSANGLMKLKRFKLKFLSISESDKWSKIIVRKIKISSNRIKSLFIFVDSIAVRCKMNGRNIFDETVKKLINDARISYVLKEIKALEDLDKIIEYVETIKNSDGILILSGDETASSIISAIINSFQTDYEFIKSVPIPFGILPIGYHNDIANSIWGCSNNIENIMLNVLLCNSFLTDILCISTNESKKRKWGFNFQYGFNSFLEKCRMENNINNTDVKEDSIMRKAIQKCGEIECNIKYDAAKSAKGLPTDNIRCHMNCLECNMQKLSVTSIPTYKFNSSIHSDSTGGRTIDSEPHHDYETYKWIIINSIPCISDLTADGFTPSCHFNDNSADIVMVKPKNKKEFKKFLTFLKSDGTHLSLPFVNSVRAEEVNLSLSPTSYWNPNNRKLSKMLELRTQSEDIIIIDEDLSQESTDEDDLNIKDKNLNVMEKKLSDERLNRKSNKFRKSIIKAYKGLTHTTYAPTSDYYKPPNMFESDRERERAAEKKKKKEEQIMKDKPVWMLDYNFLYDFPSSINIKTYSGLVSFYGNAIDCVGKA